MAAERQLQARRHGMLAVLAAMVAFATAFALMMPAISMTADDDPNRNDEAVPSEVQGEPEEAALEAADAPDAQAELAAAGVQDAVEPGSEDASDETRVSAEQDVPEAENAVDAGEASDGEEAAFAGDAESGEGAGSVSAEEAEPAAVADDVADQQSADDGSDVADGDATDDDDADEPAMPAQHFEETVWFGSPLKVVVDAPEGAFPRGTTMKVEVVPSYNVESQVKAAVATRTDVEVEEIQAVDITFRDADGTEIEPAKQITVRMVSDFIEDSSPLLVHVDDYGNASVVNPLDEYALAARNLPANDDELLFDSSDFSTYALAAAKMKDTPRESVTLKVGESTKLSSGTSGKNNWSLSKENVVTVSSESETEATITAKALGETKVTHTIDNKNTESWTITVVAADSGEYEAEAGTLSAENMTVRVQGNLNKLSGYQVVVEDASGDYSDAAAAYHIYLKDSNGNVVSNYDGKSSFKVTITYASKQDWFSQVKESKHYGTSDHKEKGFLENPSFAQDGKSISFKVSSFSDFVFVKNPSSSGGSTGGSGSVPTTGDSYLVSKTAESTGTENEFEVTLNVNPSITWPKKQTIVPKSFEEILYSTGISIRNNNNDKNTGVYDSGRTFSGAQDIYNWAKTSGLGGANGGCLVPTVALAEEYTTNANTLYAVDKIVIGSTAVELSNNFYVYLTSFSNNSTVWMFPNGKYIKLDVKYEQTGGSKKEPIGTITFSNENAEKWVLEAAAEYVAEDDIGNWSNATIAKPTSVSDPMGDYISFLNFTGIDGQAAAGNSARSSYSSANETEGNPDRISWTFSNALPKGSNQQYKEVNGTYYLTSSSYQLKYKVRLDVQKAGFRSTNPLTGAGQTWYNTNGTTTLTYPGGSQDFEVPQVVGVLYDLKIKKVDAANTGKTLAGAEFMLVGTGNNGAIEYGDGAGKTKVTATSDANGIAVFTGIPCGTYDIVEIKAPDGYSPDGETYSVTLGYVANRNGYETSSANSTHLMPTAWSGNGKVVTNEKNTVTVYKTFAVDGELPLKELDQTIYLVLQDKATKSLVRDASGNILYKTVSISGGTPVSSSVTFGAAENEKIVKGEYNVLELSAAPTSDDVSAITLTPYKDSYEASGSRNYQLTSIAGTCEYTGSDGLAYANVSGNNANLLYSNEAHVSFTNTYAYEAIKTRTFTASKKWVAADGETVLDAPQGAAVEFTLYRNIDGGDIEMVGTITLDGHPDESGEPEAWVATFRDVSIADESGKPYIYKVRETDCNQPEFAAYLHASDTSSMGANEYLTLDGGTIWNKQKTTSITVKKVDDKGKFLPGATFELYRVVSDGTSTHDVKVGNAFTVDAAEGVAMGGLVSGDYKLTELSAPDGYVILSSSIEFTVNATGTGDVIGWAGGAKPERVYELHGAGNDTMVVSNTPGKALPTTGGSGATPYTLGGLLVVAAALVYGFRMRLRERRFSR